MGARRLYGKNSGVPEVGNRVTRIDFKVMTLHGLFARFAVVLLSFCVFFLALGIPMPSLLSLFLPTDILDEASIFEGLSLPSSTYHPQQLTVTSAVEPVFVFQPITFESSLFHPPIR